MDDPIFQVNNTLNTSPNQTSQSVPSSESNADLDLGKKESSSKYLIENNKVVYKKYDEHGKIILELPLSARAFHRKV